MRTFITIPEEIAAWIGQYTKEHKKELSEQQYEKLMDFKYDDDLMSVMGNMFFREWEAIGAIQYVRPTVRKWTNEEIEKYLEAEK